jgi:hypothetical protein
VTHSFIADGEPTDDKLARIFADAAPRMRVMRERLKLDPNKTEFTALDAMLVIYKKMYNDQGSEYNQLRSWFPFRSKHILNQEFVHGTMSGEPDVLKRIQEKVEQRLTTQERCAVSIYVNEHYITGCFDTKVRLRVV